MFSSDVVVVVVSVSGRRSCRSSLLHVSRLLRRSIGTLLSRLERQSTAARRLSRFGFRRDERNDSSSIVGRRRTTEVGAKSTNEFDVGPYARNEADDAVAARFGTFSRRRRALRSTLCERRRRRTIWPVDKR